jgi:hypothetical protein
LAVISHIEDAQQQAADLGRALMRLSWAATVLGAQQAARLVSPGSVGKAGNGLAAAFDTLASALAERIDPDRQGAYRTGGLLALAPVDGLPGSEVHRALQRLAMEPALIEPTKRLLPKVVASLTALIPGADVELARRECAAKIDALKMFQDAHAFCPEPSARVKLADTVARAYARDAFEAPWALERIGDDHVSAHRHRGDGVRSLLTSHDLGPLPDGSLTALHAGVGLGLAELALEGLKPDAPASRLDAALQRFVDDCRGSSREGYLGCALESLGLVARHLYGQAMVLALDDRLAVVDPGARAFFWHGVGRAVYLSPENMVPRPDSPWPAVAIVDRDAPHDLARDNMVAGVAWALLAVNLRQPAVLEGFLRKHAPGFGCTDAFVNGLAASAIVRRDTTPEEPSLGALLAHEAGAGDSRLGSTWDAVVRGPIARALDEAHPVLVRRRLVGELFRFRPIAEIVR